MSTSSNSPSISLSDVYPRARKSILTGVFRFLSTFTEMTSRLSVSNSIHAPRMGINLAYAIGCPVVGSTVVVK